MGKIGWANMQALPFTETGHSDIESVQRTFGKHTLAELDTTGSHDSCPKRSRDEKFETQTLDCSSSCSSSPSAEWHTRTRESLDAESSQIEACQPLMSLRFQSTAAIEKLPRIAYRRASAVSNGRLTAVETGGRGICFFSSVFAAATIEPGQVVCESSLIRGAQRLREQAVAMIQTNMDHYKEYLSEECVRDFESSSCSYLQSTTWADHVLMQALADSMDCAFRLWTVDVASSGGWHTLDFHCGRPSDEIIGCRQAQMRTDDAWVKLPSGCALWLFHVDNTHFRLLRSNDSDATSWNPASAALSEDLDNNIISVDSQSNSSYSSGCTIEASSLSPAEASSLSPADVPSFALSSPASSSVVVATTPCAAVAEASHEATAKTELAFDWDDGKCGTAKCLQTWGHLGCCDPDIRTGRRKRNRP